MPIDAVLVPGQHPYSELSGQEGYKGGGERVRSEATKDSGPAGVKTSSPIVG